MSRVYAWMTSGILVTFGVAYAMNQVPELARFGQQKSADFYRLVRGSGGAVIYLSRPIHTMQAVTAMTVYLVYAGLVGLTFSVIFQAYTEDSIA